MSHGVGFPCSPDIRVSFWGDERGPVEAGNRERELESKGAERSIANGGDGGELTAVPGDPAGEQAVQTAVVGEDSGERLCMHLWASAEPVRKML